MMHLLAAQYPTVAEQFTDTRETQVFHKYTHCEER